MGKDKQLIFGISKGNQRYERYEHESRFGMVIAKNIVVILTDENAFILLANALAWNEMAEIVY